MSNTKQSNPKDSLGIKKVPLHAVPTKPLLELGLAMMEGGRKYGSHNYRKIGVKMSTYYDASMRHLMAWWEGEDIDPDSGIHHVIKAIASLFVVRDSMHMGNCVDDRPPVYPDGINMSYFNQLAAGIIKEYPECAKPFLEITNTLAEEFAKTNEDEPAEDEKRSECSTRNDGKEFCDFWGCYNRGFPKKESGNYYCPDHPKKETKDE